MKLQYYDGIEFASSGLPRHTLPTDRDDLKSITTRSPILSRYFSIFLDHVIVILIVHWLDESWGTSLFIPKCGEVYCKIWSVVSAGSFWTRSKFGRTSGWYNFKIITVLWVVCVCEVRRCKFYPITLPEYFSKSKLQWMRVGDTNL